MKLPRDCSGVDAIRALERLGFRKVRQVGSHVQLVRGERRVTVPRHAAIAPGTLRSVLRQAGIELEEFLSEL